MAGEREALAGVTQTDFGLARQIHRQIGGDAKEVGARMFEGCGGASLEEMEVGVLHDILRLLAAGAAAGEPMQFVGVRLIKARKGSVSRGHERPPRVACAGRIGRKSWRAAMRHRQSGKATWDNLVTGPGLQRATPAARMEKRLVARRPALCRERPEPHAPVCPGLKSSASWRDLDFPVPGFWNRTLAPITWRQARYGPAAGRTSRQAGERGSLCGAGKRRARSEVFGRTARGKIIFVGRARGEFDARARSQSSKQLARKKPEPPKASRHSRKQRRHKPERSKDRDDGRDRRLCRTQIRPGRN